MNPIKSSFKTEIFPVLYMFVIVVLSFYFYSKFPEQVPIHWNLAGDVDGYGSRILAAFLFPLIIMGTYALFLALPYMDPKKERYMQFRKTYHIFKNILVFFLATIYIFSSLNALGYNLPVGTWMPFFIGLLFMVIGNYMAKIKPNWFMGIRTPWTLSSEENWNKTHRFSGKVFMFSGFLFLFIPFVSEKVKIVLMVISIVMMVLGTMGYSFLLYFKQNSNSLKLRGASDKDKKYEENRESK